MTEKIVKKKEVSLFLAMGILAAALVAFIAAGMFLIKPAEKVEQGQADATSVRVSGKLLGRVAKFYVEEGQRVSAGDTLVYISSPTADAQLEQASEIANVHAMTSQKVDAGARKQVIQSAKEMWTMAQTAEAIKEKTYNRVENLFKQGVVTEQKRDEAKAAYDAAKAQTLAAKSQYDLALEGAQNEDKAAARSAANAARATVKQVESVLEDQYLIAPCDGEVSDIYPHEGELVAAGAPIMSIMKDDVWLVFNVREQKLENMKMGDEITVFIPALGNKEVKAKVFRLRDMGSYAVWSATKTLGDYDSKTFEVKARPVTPVEGLRPGMSAIIK
ncbi:MAG: efflux RND transporter periplasmic adaptor subunit [Muribaculaceae bacterium]|nr:efflux RND transporter periplasmic adaptor subunit [Muribaculaceae bacterium]